MSQRVITQLVSDLTGEEIEDGEGRTVTFGLEGAEYSIDLTDDEAAELERALARYIAVATRTNRRSRTVGNFRRATPTTGDDPKQIREWANSNGFRVGDRGRIPAEVRDAYAAAH